MKINNIQNRENLLIIELESYDTAILELIIDRLNKHKDVAAAYEETHPLTHQYKLIVKAKDPKGTLKKVIEELVRP